MITLRYGAAFETANRSLPPSSVFIWPFSSKDTRPASPHPFQPISRQSVNPARSSRQRVLHAGQVRCRKQSDLKPDSRVDGVTCSIQCVCVITRGSIPGQLETIFFWEKFLLVEYSFREFSIAIMGKDYLVIELRSLTTESCLRQRSSLDHVCCCVETVV